MNIYGNDKRRHPRLGVYHLAKYSPIPNPEQKKPALACFKDISGGGVCLQTEEPLSAGTVIQLYINIPWISQPVISIAKVTWAKKAAKGKLNEAGIQFLEIEEAVRDDITKRIDFAREAPKNKPKR